MVRRRNHTSTEALEAYFKQLDGADWSARRGSRTRAFFRDFKATAYNLSLTVRSCFSSGFLQ